MFPFFFFSPTFQVPNTISRLPRGLESGSADWIKLFPSLSHFDKLSYTVTHCCNYTHRQALRARAHAAHIQACTRVQIQTESPELSIEICWLEQLNGIQRQRHSEKPLRNAIYTSVLISLTGRLRFTWLKRLLLVFKNRTSGLRNQPGRRLISLNGAKARCLALHSIEYKIKPAWYSPSTARLFLSSIKAAISLKAAKIIL